MYIWNYSKIYDTLLLISQTFELNQNDPLALKIKHSHHPEIIADFYSSGMIEVLRRWVENDYNYSVDEIFATLHDILDISLNCK